MSDLVSALLGMIGNFPWKSPWIGLLFSVASALVGYFFVPATVFALGILFVSVVLAALCAVMAGENGSAATLVGIYFSLVVGALASSLNIIPEPYKCAITNRFGDSGCLKKQMKNFGDTDEPS